MRDAHRPPRSPRHYAPRRSEARHRRPPPRRYRSVYSIVPPKLLSREGRYLAAVFACGLGAVLSHRSAAALHGLREWGHTKIEVTIPGRSHRGHDGILIRRSRTLNDHDVTVVGGIPVTTVARTQLDLGEVVTRRQLERAFDQAEVIGIFDLRALEDQLQRNARDQPPRSSGPSSKSTTSAAHRRSQTSRRRDRHQPRVRPSGSRDQRLHRPEMGNPPAQRPIQADLVWRAQRIVIELDGHKFQYTRQAFERDRRNDQRLIAAGWLVIRVTWKQLKNEPERIRRTILTVMARARAVAASPRHASTRPRAAPG